MFEFKFLFNKKLCTTFKLLFIIIFPFKIIYQNKPLFILDFQQIMNSYEFKEIIVFKDFDDESGVLELERDVYLSIVKFLDTSNLRKV
jgi:hypothetical protein